MTISRNAISNYQYTYFDARILSNKHNNILIDEVKDIEDWEKSAKGYHTDNNVDILITGSNSKILSVELDRWPCTESKIILRILCYMFSFHN